MFHIKVLTGKSAGTQKDIRLNEFPWVVGRPPARLSLEDPGVWDRHLELSLDAGNTLQVRVHPQALALKNGVAFSETALRNGDLLQISSVQLEISLGTTEQRGLRPREIITWASLVVVALSQVALVYWLFQL